MGTVDSLIVQVAIPRPLDKLFTYKVPKEFEKKISLGAWVKVPFGKSELIGYIAETSINPDFLNHFDESKIKTILDMGDEDKAIQADVFELCKFASKYYQAPLGELLHAASPPAAMGFKNKKGAKKLDWDFSQKITPHKNPLSIAQKKIFDELDENRKLKNPKPALLHGVTGSGKTEIYIELAHQYLQQGQSVLLLVPEIALTSQLQNRLSNALGEYVALWHSAVSDGKRRDETAALLEGKIRVVVGARSAVFAPLKNLGLIIIDEEHDPTFKQEDRVRYHARDLAIMRAKICNAFLLMGSATPSIETLEKCSDGKFTYHPLNIRHSEHGLPDIELIDLTEEPMSENTQCYLAEKTINEIQRVVDAGEQVIIFLNRRGFASFLLCKDCGEVKQCKECSISLTFHKKDRLLKCHVCGYKESIPDTCPKCQSSELIPMGAGTESLEEDLPKLISNTKLLRLDRDTVTSQSRLEKTLQDFRDKKANILLGTQMLAKGHDFPDVTLVVVILADSLFRYPDFRAGERALQLLTQVSGRAGRAEKRGKVLIQTFCADQLVLQVLTKKLDEKTYIDHEKNMRKEFSYPPYSRLCRLRIEDKNSFDAQKKAKKIAECLQHTLSQNESSFGALAAEILGPSEAFLEKAKGKHRWDILIKAKKVDVLLKLVQCAKELSLQNQWSLLVDIDPYGLG